MGPAPMELLVKAPFDKPAVVGVVVLLGESVAVDFAAAAWDFLRCAAGFERWLAPVGLPRRTEHFWKCLLRMSLLEKVSLHRTHMYGRSPVSVQVSEPYKLKVKDTHVSACGASNAWHANRSCCSLGTGICRLRPSQGQHCWSWVSR
jgi:hypothetical protein